MRSKRFVLICAFGSMLMASAHAASPKLIVAILIDQLRYDYLERFQDQFTTNGFRLFTDHGAVMTFAHYNYVPTLTGPGHASFLSGSTPSMHGIIANDWLDKKSGKQMYCVEDQSVDAVGTTPAKGRMSPKNFVGDTFADELRLRFHSKVVGISMKDRGAILPAGKKPTGAFWFDSKKGNFATSTYYMAKLPPWVEDFNKRKRAADFMGQTWDRLIDEKSYDYPDSATWEGNLADEKKPVFPHVVAKSEDSFENIMPTPFGNQILAEFAEAAIEGEKLGQSSQPDLLCVSFSSIDYCGHKFGPYSQEMQDIVLRMDRQLGNFFDYLNQKVGLTNVLLTLTADHAMAPIPEFARDQGLDGQRLNEKDFMADLKEELGDEFGPGKYFQSSKIFSGNVYLNHATLQKRNLKEADVFAFIRDFALASGKIQACYSREQLLNGQASGPLGQMAVNGYNGERGGDIVLLEKPYSIPGTDKTGSTHGSPYLYDTHVPVMFYGAAFKPGYYADDFWITDIAPTLCTVLHMNEPAGNMGKPFVKALADR